MRRNDWASRMFDVIAEHAERPFAWGKDDCCLFVARVWDAMNDTSHELTLQIAYHDEPSALAFIESHGDLKSAVTAFLGEPIEARATRGDAVMINGGLDMAMGICLGSEVVAMGPTGL